MLLMLHFQRRRSDDIGCAKPRSQRKSAARLVLYQLVFPANGLSPLADGNCAGHNEAVVGQRLFEGGNDRVALARSRVEGDQVVVVEVDSVDAQGGELLDHALGRNHPAHGIAKRVTTRIADGPEAKREHV